VERSEFEPPVPVVRSEAASSCQFRFSVSAGSARLKRTGEGLASDFARSTCWWPPGERSRVVRRASTAISTLRTVSLTGADGFIFHSAGRRTRNLRQYPPLRVGMARAFWRVRRPLWLPCQFPLKRRRGMTSRGRQFSPSHNYERGPRIRSTNTQHGRGGAGLRFYLYACAHASSGAAAGNGDAVDRAAAPTGCNTNAD
jgi:hypothetical protein